MKRWMVFTYGVSTYAYSWEPFSTRPDSSATLESPSPWTRPGGAPSRQHWPSISEAAERSTYVLVSSVALILLFALWRPIGGVVWDVGNPNGRLALHGLFAFGFALVLVSTFLINHFDLFGLRQVWLYLRQRPYTTLRFRTPGVYKLVRHPLYVGWLFAFWATPTMTTTHLVFALVTTGYIRAAIPLEERDLVTAFGPLYTEYRRRVPMLVPRLLGRRAEKADATAVEAA
jgi:protein-S-isoprenylcysteine O-methyltransferase Ste14